MAGPLSAVDHVMIGAPTLDALHKIWRGLGFTLTPRAVHGGGATANHCVMFRESYIELIAPTGAAASPLADVLAARGPGGLGIAFAAPDAEATADALRDAGVATQDPVALSRPLELDGRTETVSFRNVLFEGGLSGVLAFACHHETPHLTRARAEWQLHANGATALSEIVIGAEHPAEFRPALERLFGIDHVAEGPHGLSVVLDGIALAVTNPVGLAQRFGAKAVAGLAPLPGLAALAIVINEADAAGAMLDMARIPYADSHHGLVVAAKDAGGVIVELAED